MYPSPLCACDDARESDRLAATSRVPPVYVPPYGRGHEISHCPVYDTTRLLGLVEVAVHWNWSVYGGTDGGARYFEKHGPPHLIHAYAEDFYDMEADRCAFAVSICCYNYGINPGGSPAEGSRRTVGWLICDVEITSKCSFSGLEGIPS